MSSTIVKPALLDVGIVINLAFRPLERMDLPEVGLEPVELLHPPVAADRTRSN
jgi:hypothetical protein